VSASEADEAPDEAVAEPAEDTVAAEDAEKDK
jgi:hypothetical protein